MVSLTCGANRDHSPDPWLVLAERMAAAGIGPDGYARIGPLTFGAGGIRVDELDRRTAGRRRTIRGVRDRRIADPAAVVLHGDSGYRQRDRELLTAAATPLGLNVANRPSGHVPGRPAPNRLTDDQRRDIGEAMTAAVERCKRERIRGATYQAAKEVVREFGYVCTTGTAIDIWRASRRQEEQA